MERFLAFIVLLDLSTCVFGQGTVWDVFGMFFELLGYLCKQFSLDFDPYFLILWEGDVVSLLLYTPLVQREGYRF